MRKFLLLVVIVCLAGCKTSSDMISSAGHFDTGGSSTYQDKDWNLEFYENCDLPESSSIRWVTEGKETFLRFTLKNKHVGGCSSDGFARHRAPYWERAEIKQATTLKKDANHKLTFRIRFVKGFSYERESFFQIHQSVSGCRVGPPLIVKVQYGYFRGGHHKAIDINKIIGKWIDVRLDFNLENQRYDLYFDDKKLMNGGYLPVESCGEPHFKFGIYRPGNEETTGERISILDIDKIRLVEKKK